MFNIRNNKSSLIFVLNIILTCIFIFIIIKLVPTIQNYTNPTQISNKVNIASLPISNPILNNISTWKTYNFIMFRLIQESNQINPNNYTLLINYDWNKLNKTLDSFQFNLQNKQTQDLNNTVNSMDTTTLNGVINDWQNSSVFLNISNYTNLIFGLGPTIPNDINQSAILNFIDSNNNTVTDLTNIIYISITNRLMSIKLPLTLVNSTSSSVLLQYRPNFSTVNKTNTSSYNLDFQVSNNQLTINSPSNTNSDIIIPLD